MQEWRYKPVLKAKLKIGLLACLALLFACSDSDRLPAKPSGSFDAASKVPITTQSVEAREAYLKAVSLMDSLHYSESREYLDQALQYDPDFALAHLLRARTALSAEEFFASLESAERVQERVSLGEQLIIRAFRAATQGDSEPRLAILRKLVALYPTDETAHMRLGNFHVAEQQYKEAVVRFNRAIEISPEYAPAYNMLGYAHRGLKDFEAAKDAFQRYVELVPDEPNPYDSYAELLMESGDYTASIRNYQKALDIDPNFLSSLAGISINEALRGDTDKAIAVAEQMLQRSRNLADRRAATARLAGAHLHAGDYSAALDAIDQLAKAGAEAKNSLVVADAEELAADILLLQGDADAAIKLYESVLERRRVSELHPPAKARAKRQFLYKSTLAALQSGWSKTAADNVRRYRADASNGGNAFERQRINELEGYAALLQEDYEKAAERLLAANPLSPVVQYFTAVAYQGAGDLKAAREHAFIAAYRNTLAPSLPYFRKQALAMIETIDAQLAGST